MALGVSGIPPPSFSDIARFLRATAPRSSCAAAPCRSSVPRRRAAPSCRVAAQLPAQFLCTSPQLPPCRTAPKNPLFPRGDDSQGSGRPTLAERGESRAVVLNLSPLVGAQLLSTGRLCPVCFCPRRAGSAVARARLPHAGSRLTLTVGFHLALAAGHRVALTAGSRVALSASIVVEDRAIDRSIVLEITKQASKEPCTSSYEQQHEQGTNNNLQRSS
ncbi:uncharacterized protein LOC123404946 [Hordeum vulgare subsp. vulgare]|uniref:uncharacterized protein LOC123404946 n=1 Tax=Hordeum vulgare subsp. vulgare TaxID=112509 RepID=UPI001D1A4FE4|nr:uncharacterized protein LOC123404946 [Hordeum vulgare subsp. vulgare]